MQKTHLFLLLYVLAVDQGKHVAVKSEQFEILQKTGTGQLAPSCPLSYPKCLKCLCLISVTKAFFLATLQPTDHQPNKDTSPWELFQNMWNKVSLWFFCEMNKHILYKVDAIPTSPLNLWSTFSLPENQLILWRDFLTWEFCSNGKKMLLLELIFGVMFPPRVGVHDSNHSRGHFYTSANGAVPHCLKMASRSTASHRMTSRGWSQPPKNSEQVSADSVELIGYNEFIITTKTIS